MKLSVKSCRQRHFVRASLGKDNSSSLTLTDLLEEQTTVLRTEVYGLLMNQTTRIVCQCGWDKTRNESYQKLLTRYPPLQSLAVPISQIIAEIEHCSTEDMGSGGRYCSDRYNYHNPRRYNIELLSKLDSIRKGAGISINFIFDRRNGNS
jgi:hypothetical protein